MNCKECGQAMRQSYIFDPTATPGETINHRLQFVCDTCKTGTTFNIDVYKKWADMVDIDMRLLISCIKIHEGKPYLEIIDYIHVTCREAPTSVLESLLEWWENRPDAAPKLKKIFCEIIGFHLQERQKQLAL